MNITFEELMELARKAALYDGIINYIKTRGVYSTREDIIAFVGESEPAEGDSEGGDTNV